MPNAVSPAEIRSLSCPVCDVPAGSQCVDGCGHPRPPHNGRVLSAYRHLRPRLTGRVAQVAGCQMPRAAEYDQTYHGGASKPQTRSK